MSEDALFVLQREAAKQPFSFKLEDRKVSIPHIADVDQFKLAEIFNETGGDLSFITTYFRAVMDAEEFEALQSAKPSRPMLDKLWAAYQKHCGLKEGE